MADMSTAPTPPALARPILISLAAMAVLLTMSIFLTGWALDLSQLIVAVLFFAFGLLAQSAYASIYMMEPSFATRMSHAVGFSLFVIAFLMVLWWIEGSAFPLGMLIAIGLAFMAIPVSYVTFYALENTEALVDRSTLARGTPALDDHRWLLALAVFAAAVGFAFYVAPIPNPLMLAFWAIVGTALLAPTMDVEQPQWMLRTRDGALLIAGVLCLLSINGLPF